MLKTIVWRARNAGSENSNSSIMLVRFAQTDKKIAANAFTLAEILIAIVVLVMVMAGLLWGYVQINRMALWSSMSLAAQSIATQGAEAARCAKWDTQVYGTNIGPNTPDELSPLQSPWVNGFNPQYQNSNYCLDIPVSGAPIYVTNYVYISQIQASPLPQLRQIRSDCVWVFNPAVSGTNSGQLGAFTNTVITLRAPDE